MDKRGASKKCFRCNRVSSGWIGTLILIVLCCSIQSKASAQKENTLFQEAISNAEAGKNTAAIETYDTLIQNGYINPGIFHNQALLFLDENQKGRAVLAYEKCIKLHGTKGICASNLKMLRSSIEGYDVRYASVRTGLFFDFVIQKVSSFIFGFLSILFFAGGVILLYKKGMWHRRFLWVTILCLFGVIMMIAGLRRQYLSTNNDFGIIVQEDTELLIGPDFDSKQLYPLESGVKVKILRDDGDWLRVLLYNRDEGWVPVEALGRI